MSERGRDTASDRGREGEWVQYVEKNASEIVHLHRKDRNNVGKMWKGRTLQLGSHPQSVLTGAERGVGDGLTAGGSFIFLPVSPPPHPSISSTASGHLSPSKFLFLSYSIRSFFIFFFVICPSTLPSLPFFSFDWQWHRRSVWRQGLLITSNMPGILCTVLHAFTWHQGNSDYLHTKLFFFLFTAYSFCYALWFCLPITFSLLLRWGSHPLPLIFSAGYEEGSLCRACKSIVEQHYAVTKE